MSAVFYSYLGSKVIKGARWAWEWVSSVGEREIPRKPWAERPPPREGDFEEPLEKSPGFLKGLMDSLTQRLESYLVSKTTSFTPEQEAFVERIAKGHLEGSLAMDEKDFADFQRLSQELGFSDGTVGAGGAPKGCNLHDPSVLEAALTSFYALANPNKVASAASLALKHSRHPSKLAKMLAEKYPAAKRLGDHCPMAGDRPDSGGGLAALWRGASAWLWGSGFGPPSVAALPKAWETAPATYRNALLYFLGFSLLMAVAPEPPLASRPAEAGRLDGALLACLALGAVLMKPGDHTLNALVLATAGCHVAWVIARKAHQARQRAAAQTRPKIEALSGQKQERRRDWYNY